MHNPVFLVGPTCVGKSEVAISLAKCIGAEIVTCDSMQVYRGMNIATDKPTSPERDQVPHHMIDVVDITQEYDVSQYRESAWKVISDIQNRGKIPLVVGGTGLYVKALMDGLFIGPGKEKGIRNKLEKRIEREGLSSVYEELKRLDPVACLKIKSRDKRRIIRALEVYYITGKSISSFQKQWEKKVNYIIIGLDRLRKDLYRRIDRRVEEMFERGPVLGSRSPNGHWAEGGLVEETKELLRKGIMQNETASQALGYNEVMGYLEGRYNLDEVKDLLKRNTRRFAKRQLTWFRKDDRVKWFLIREDEEVEVIVGKLCIFLRRYI